MGQGQIFWGESQEFNLFRPDDRKEKTLGTVPEFVKTTPIVCFSYKFSSKERNWDIMPQPCVRSSLPRGWRWCQFPTLSVSIISCLFVYKQLRLLLLPRLLSFVSLSPFNVPPSLIKWLLWSSWYCPSPKLNPQFPMKCFARSQKIITRNLNRWTHQMGTILEQCAVVTPQRQLML